MKLPENVRTKIGDRTVLAIYPNIYLPKKVFDNLKSKNPDPKYIDVLVHEQKHLKRQKEIGLLKWGIKYVFSPKFRLSEEILAIKAQKKIDVKKSAKDLSSWIYLWMVSYKTAKKKLERF
jgi:hypothetical protein